SDRPGRRRRHRPPRPGPGPPPRRPRRLRPVAQQSSPERPLRCDPRARPRADHRLDHAGAADRFHRPISPAPTNASSASRVDVILLAPSEEVASFSGNAFAAIADARQTARMEIKSLLVTKLDRAAVEGIDNAALLRRCRALAEDLAAGRPWSKEHGYQG